MDIDTTASDDNEEPPSPGPINVFDILLTDDNEELLTPEELINYIHSQMSEEDIAFISEMADFLNEQFDEL